MKKQDISTDDIVRYLDELKNNPAERERFARSIKREADKERRRDGGEFSAMFLDAIRIP